MLRFNTIVAGCVSVGLIGSLISCSDEGDDDDNPGTAATSGFGAMGGGTSGSGGNGAGTGGAAGATGSGGSGAGTMTCDFPPEFAECGTQSSGATFERVNLLLVIDKSGSMTNTVAGGVSRWDALSEALRTALPNVQERVNLGVEFFPTQDLPEGDCVDVGVCCSVATDSSAVVVPVGDGVATVPDILAQVDATVPKGGTPTANALQAAYDYYVNGAGSGLEGQKFVVLATDGGPNCDSSNSCDETTCTTNMDGKCASGNCCDPRGGSYPDGPYYCLDEANTLAQITALHDANVSTFVIGIPGTEQYAASLNAFAIAGGEPVPEDPSNPDAPRYFAVSEASGVQGLTDVFVEITTNLIQSCEIDLEREPPDPTLVNVFVDCEVQSFVDSATATTSGWHIDPATPTRVTLTGPLCTFVESQGVGQIDVMFGCPRRVIE